MATIIKTTSKDIRRVKTLHAPANGIDYSLEELQGFVGGNIELVYTQTSKILVVDEEGALNKDFNLLATRFAKELGANVEMLFGDVAVIENEQIK